MTLALIITLMVISSPIVMLVNPASVVAAAASMDSTRVDSSNYHSTPRIPDTPSTSIPAIARAPSSSPTLNQGIGSGDFTSQAPLSPPASYLSNDLVGSNTIYEIVFVPTTTGTIKKIEMTFPIGTGISAVGILDRVGIGAGTLIKAGTTVTFTVNNAISVPAGTFIRLEMVNVKSPLSPSSAYQVTVTTRDPANSVIDGPTPSTAYNIRRIGSNDIADGAITSTKPAESFMKRVTLIDDPAGNAKGWNPNGVQTGFQISEAAISSDIDNSFFIVENIDPGVFLGSLCVVRDHSTSDKNFSVTCSDPPAQGNELHYVVGNLPEHVICGPGICRE